MVLNGYGVNIRARRPAAQPERGAGCHPGDHVGGVVDAHVGPTGGDDGRQRPPQRRRPAAVPPGQHHGREGGRAGVTGGERRRHRLAHGESRVTGDGRSLAPEQALEALVDQEALDAEGEGERRHLASPPVAGQSAGDVGDVPDQAEVAEVRGRREDGVGHRVAAHPLRARRRPSGRSGRPGRQATSAGARRSSAPRPRRGRDRRRSSGTTAGRCTMRTWRSAAGGSRRSRTPARRHATQPSCGW